MNNGNNNDGTLAATPDGVVESLEDPERRRFITAAAAVAGTIGIAASTGPFIESMEPSGRTVAGGKPVEIDISKLKPGEMMITPWRKKPVWVLHRTPEQLEELGKLNERLKDPRSEAPQQPPDLPHWDMGQRSIKPQYLLVVGICTHLSCIPEYLRKGDSHGLGSGWPGGFFCPCHGSRFDLSGRVMKGSPAPLNLPVIPHYFKNDTTIVAGSMADGSEQNWSPDTW